MFDFTRDGASGGLKAVHLMENVARNFRNFSSMFKSCGKIIFALWISTANSNQDQIARFFHRLTIEK